MILSASPRSISSCVVAGAIEMMLLTCAGMVMGLPLRSIVGTAHSCAVLSVVSEAASMDSEAASIEAVVCA